MLPSAERFLSLFLSAIGGAKFSPALRTRLEAVLCVSRVAGAFRPSVLAISVLSHLLEAQQPLAWLPTIHSFLKQCEVRKTLKHIRDGFQVDGAELIACREMVSQVWAAHEIEQRIAAAAEGAAKKRATRRKVGVSSMAPRYCPIY